MLTITLCCCSCKVSPDLTTMSLLCWSRAVSGQGRDWRRASMPGRRGCGWSTREVDELRLEC